LASAFRGAARHSSERRSSIEITPRTANLPILRMQTVPIFLPRSASVLPHRNPQNGPIGRNEVAMKIARPLLLISTPLGVAGGIYEAFRLAGGLAFIMVALVAIIGAAMAMLVRTIRHERLAEEAAAAHSRSAATRRGSFLGDL
jgi:hypothetical protein